MKQLFLLVTGALLFACTANDKNGPSEQRADNGAGSQQVSSDSANHTTIEWLDPVEQDLGQIKKGQVAEVSWKFKNTGNKPLLITDVRAACGCTVPNPPKEPIAPGEESVIKATFNSSGFSGRVKKTVTVIANNSNHNNGNEDVLSFSADVQE